MLNIITNYLFICLWAFAFIYGAQIICRKQVRKNWEYINEGVIDKEHIKVPICGPFATFILLLVPIMNILHIALVFILIFGDIDTPII